MTCLNLTTHFFFSLAVGFLFFGQPAIVFLVALGALLPALDREYWFILSKEWSKKYYIEIGFFCCNLYVITNPFMNI